MGVIARQSIKSSIAIYAGILVGIANRIYFYPKFLSEGELGMVTVILAIATILSQFSFLGVSTTITKFYDYFNKKNQLNVFTGYFLSIPLIGFLIFGFLFLVFKNQIIDFYYDSELSLGNYYYSVLPLSLIILYMHLFMIYSHNNMRLTIPSLLTDFSLKVYLMIGLILIAVKVINFNHFILFIISSYALTTIILGSYCYINFKPKISFKYFQISKSDYKKIISYSGFVFLGGISGSIIMYTDTLMLSSIQGFGAAGVYTIAFFAGTVIEIPKRAIISISSPIIAKYWNEEKKTEINNLYKKTSINQGAIGLLLLLLLWINLDELFSILPNSQIYSTGKYVAVFIGLARVVDMFSGINSEILQTSSRYKYNFILIVAFIVISVSLNWFLIPIYKINGAAIASLISVTLYNLARYILLKRFYNFNPFSFNSMKLLAVWGVILILGLLFPNLVENTNQFNIILNILIKTIIFGSVFTIIIFYLKISTEINNMMKKYFRFLP